jgi:hypothetical protein
VYISVTSTFGCVYDTLYSNLITVFQGPQSDFVISPEHVSMFTPNTHLLLTNPIDTLSYTWIIPNGSPNTSSSDIVSVSYPEDQPNVYPVSLVTMTQDGCRDTTIHYVYVDSDVLLYVPNTFTPDGDQFNQTWKISILGASTDRFEWNVFNRWPTGLVV